MTRRIRQLVAGWTADHYFRAMTAWAAGLAAMQVGALSLSLLEIRISQGFAATVLVLSVVAGWGAWRLAQPAQGLDADAPASPAWPLVVVPVSAAVLGVLLVVAMLRPDWSWDGNAYHVPLANLWVRRGYVYWVDDAFRFGPEMNGYPNAAEVVSFVLVRAFGTSAVANAATFALLPLGVAAIAHLARRLGAPGELALAAGAAFPLVPVNLFQCISTYVDTGFACCVASLVSAVAAGAAGAWSIRRGWAVALAVGCGAGLTLGVKGSGAALAAVAFVVLAAVAVGKVVRGARGGGVRAALAVVAFLLASSAIALAVGGYWCVRNWRQEGSPLYPVGLRAAGVEVFPGKTVDEAILAGENTPDFMTGWSGPRRFAFTWLQGGRLWPESAFGFDSRLGGLGWLWPLGCLPAIVLLLPRILGRLVGRPGLPAAAALAIVLAGFLLTPMNWWPRYTVWLYAAGLPLFAVAAGQALAGGRRVLRLWPATCIVLLLVEALVCTGRIVHDAACESFVRLEATDEPGTGRRIQYWQPVAALSGTMLDDIVAGSQAVAAGHLPGRCAMTYGTISTPIGRRDVVALPAAWGPSLMAKVRRAGARYVLWPDEGLPPRELAEQAARLQRAGGLWLIELEVAAD